MPERINIYAGITLIKANDKTPKNQRVGNYYKQAMSPNGKYIHTVSIERFNTKFPPY